MTIQEYIYKYQEFFPVYRIGEVDYIGGENRYEFTCDCGQHCLSYGWYEFQRTCIDCAIKEVTADLIWKWYLQKDGANCFTKEQYLRTKPYGEAKDYGHRNLRVLIFIANEANKKFEQLINNFEYKTLLDFEIGKHHKEGARNYDKQKHIKTIHKSLNRKIHGYCEYFDALNKISEQLELQRRDIPKELVLIQLNLFNQNRLLRLRRKNYV